VDGEGAAKYIRSTNSKNTNTPIIAVSAYSGSDPNEGTSNVFSGSLAKPLQKTDLLSESEVNLNELSPMRWQRSCDSWASRLRRRQGALAPRSRPRKLILETTFSR
jgi:CheY-like chemotaxis protein